MHARPRRRAGRCCSRPDAEVRPRRRRLARRAAVPRERARAPALPLASTAAGARPSGRGGCSARRCVLRGLRLPRRARRGATARSPRWLGSGDVELAACRERLPAPLAFGSRSCSRRALSSRGRSACGGAAATLAWALAAVFAAWAVTFAVSASLDADARAAARDGPGGALPCADARRRRIRPRARARRSRSAVRRAAAERARAAALARRRGRRRRRPLPPRPRAQARSSSATSTSGRVNEFADGGLHPGYAFPLWHGFLALVAKVSGLDPSIVVHHEPSLLAPLAALVALRGRLGVFDGPCRRGWPCRRRGARRVYASPPARRRVHGARPARDRRRGSCSCRPRSRSALAATPQADARRCCASPPRRVARAGARPPDLCAVRAAAVRRLRCSSAGCGGAWTCVSAARPRGAAGVPTPSLLRVAAARRRARRPRSTPDAAERLRALRPVRRAARRRLAPTATASSPELLRADRRGRGRGASRSCRSPALAARRRVGGVRASAGRSPCSRCCSCPRLFARFSDAVSLSQSRRVAGFLPLAVRVRGRARRCSHG